MRLVTKGLLLLLIPSVAQLCVLTGFYLVHEETGYYPLRAQHDVEYIVGLVRYFLDDFCTVLDIQNAFVRKIPMDVEAEKHMRAMVTDGNEMKEFYRNFAKRRRALVIFPTPVGPEFAQGDSWFGMITGATQAAFDLEKQLEKKPDPDLVQRVAKALHDAMAHVANAGRSQFTYGVDPHYSTEERDRYRILIAIGSFTNLLTVLLALVLFSRNISRRLSTLLNNVEQFKNGEDPIGTVSGDDEIGKIAKTFDELFKNFRETMFPHKAMMEHSQDLICLLDANGRVSSTSRSCITLLGYSPDEMTGVWLTDLVTSDLQHFTGEKLVRVAAGETLHPFESRLIREDKSLVDVLISVTWSERDRAMFCVAHDITERKAAEQLQQDVVHMVSHDLKTPLNAISNFHEMLETGMYGELQEKNLEQVKRAQRSTERMLTLIKDLLDIERMNSGMLDLEIHLVDLDEVIAHSKESIEGLADQAAIRVVAPPTQLKVLADQARLTQIFINLLSNAIKFSPPNSEVKIFAAQDKQYTSVTVADQGRGIPPELQNSIFDRFAQTRSSDATVQGGSGLGLSICQALARLHGGDITVESEVNKGSRFCVRLPNVQPQVN